MGILELKKKSNPNRGSPLNSSVRTSFGLDSKTRLDSSPTSPNNEFVERGKKTSLNLEKI